jgi:hypothetical protein
LTPHSSIASWRLLAVPRNAGRHAPVRESEEPSGRNSYHRSRACAESPNGRHARRSRLLVDPVCRHLARRRSNPSLQDACCENDRRRHRTRSRRRASNHRYALGPLRLTLRYISGNHRVPPNAAGYAPYFRRRRPGRKSHSNDLARIPVIRRITPRRVPGVTVSEARSSYAGTMPMVSSRGRGPQRPRPRPRQPVQRRVHRVVPDRIPAPWVDTISRPDPSS